MEARELDQVKPGGFEQQMRSLLNTQATGLLVGIGYKTGLFDTMAGLPPSTSRQIALSGGLNERYVREWLSAMVLGRILDYNPGDQTYYLPPERAAWLTRKAGANSLGSLAQFMTALSEVEPMVVKCFKDGGGVPGTAYTRLGQAEWADAGTQPVDSVLEVVPDVTDRLSKGIDVADIGCGGGEKLNMMAGAFPNSQFTGYDISEDAIANARVQAKAKGLVNVHFEVEDAATLGDVEKWDLVTAFFTIHDQAKPRSVLRGIERALRPGGAFLMVEVAASSRLEENLDHPLGSWHYGWSIMYCIAGSLSQNGEGLGAMWGTQKALEMLAEAGFARVDAERIESMITQVCFVARKHQLS